MMHRQGGDGIGEFLGEFYEGDRLLSITRSGTFRTTTFEALNRYADDTIYIKRFDPAAVFSAAYYDAGQGFFYLKRFAAEPSASPQNFVDENNAASYAAAVSDEPYPQLEVEYEANGRLPASKEYVDVEQFVGVKGFRAKGKRLAVRPVCGVRFAEPLRRQPLVPPDPSPIPDEDIPAANAESEQITLGF